MSDHLKREIYCKKDVLVLILHSESPSRRYAGLGCRMIFYNLTVKINLTDMRKTSFTFFMTLLLSVLATNAQVTTSPTPLQETSQDVTIYFHADQGNRGLMGLNANTKIYAHTGLITSKSTSASDWKYTIADWNKDTAKAQMVYEGPNLWSLHIGDIRSFYGVTDINEVIEQLAFVFRTSGGTKEGKTAQNGDIMVTVYDPGLQVVLSSSISNQIVDSTTGAVTFTANTTAPANIAISINGNQVTSTQNATSLEYVYTFPSVGQYTVTATATAGGETVSDSLNFAYFNASQAQNYPGGKPVMGPVANPDGSVTFCVAAPGMDRMIIVGSWNDYQVTASQQMYYQDYVTTNPVTNESGTFRYFWITIPDLAKTTDQYVYFFKVAGSVTVGSNTLTINTNTCDPYARLVLDPWNDKYIDTDVYPDLPAYPYEVAGDVPVAVYQSNINDYDWQVTDFKLPSKDNLIIYEMLFRDFTGTEGAANGNGTVQQAIAKFDYLKKLGVNVIEVLPIYEFDGNISWGYNPNFYFAPDKAYGTPDDYKEFIDLCHQNGIAVVLDMVFNQTEGLHPWCQMYGGTQFSPFYNATAPHAYSVLNDWNQGYPLVQIQWADVLEYWLKEYHFDGFRFDLVKGLGTNQSYANNGDDATNRYNASRVAEMKYLNGIIQSIKPGAYCINENLALPQEENEMAADGEINWANVNYQAAQFAMGISSGSNMNILYAPQNSRTWGSTVSYLESHDEQRLAYRQDQGGANGVKGNVVVSMQRLGSAAAQMLMTPGAHMIWQFSEMGNAQNTKNNTGGNDTDPKIVNWNLLTEPNHLGLYENYCEMIDVRMKYPKMFWQEANFSIYCNSTNWASGRILSSVYNGMEIYTVINPNITGQITVSSINFLHKDNSAYQILSQSYGANSSFDATTNSVTVPANCYVVIGSADLSAAGIEGIAADTFGLRVRGGYGEIIVDNAPGSALVYSLDGRKVGRIEGNGSLSVSPGLYIVKCREDSVKVIVR